MRFCVFIFYDFSLSVSCSYKEVVKHKHTAAELVSSVRHSLVVKRPRNSFSRRIGSIVQAQLGAGASAHSHQFQHVAKYSHEQRDDPNAGQSMGGEYCFRPVAAQFAPLASNPERRCEILIHSLCPSVTFRHFSAFAQIAKVVYVPKLESAKATRNRI